MLEAEVRILAGRAGASAQLTIPSRLPSVRMAGDHAQDMDARHARTGWRARRRRRRGKGIEGFRHSHTQAQRALDIARLARPGHLGPLVRYEQVRLLDVLSQDMSLAREFVITELGGLASTKARTQELRATLLQFLAANRSYQAVARTSHLHKNTVVKRVARRAAHRRPDRRPPTRDPHRAAAHRYLRRPHARSRCRALRPPVGRRPDLRLD